MGDVVAVGEGRSPGSGVDVAVGLAVGEKAVAVGVVEIGCVGEGVDVDSADTTAAVEVGVSPGSRQGCQSMIAPKPMTMRMTATSPIQGSQNGIVGGAVAGGLAGGT